MLASGVAPGLRCAGIAAPGRMSMQQRPMGTFCLIYSTNPIRL